MVKKYYLFIKIFLISSVLAGGIVNTAYAAHCPVFVAKTDGCSGSQLINSNFLHIFAAACDQHDTCYSTIGMTRGGCDNALLGKMKAACHGNYGKRLLGHADPVYAACELSANAMYSVLRNDISGDPQSYWVSGQTTAMNAAASLATLNCDIPDANGVTHLTTGASRVFGGAVSDMVSGIAADSVLNGGRSKKLNTTQISNVLTHYRTNGNNKPARISCGMVTKQIGTKTRCVRDSPWTCRTVTEPVYGQVEVCNDNNWQNEVIRDLQMGLDVWNGNYSNPSQSLTIPEQIAQMCEAFYGPPSPSNSAYQACLLM